ncbi:MAG: septum formation initiator family protein [Bacteroidales bacterium]|nr:septum formation initiator family protein [Bacteroidales bacterium]
MGKFSKIWNRSKDGANHEERSFVRYAIVSTVIFLLFICVIKRDNLFRWIEAGLTIHRQEKQMEYYDADIARLKDELNSLTTDRDTLEKFAREKFLFAEPGEDVYVQE